LKTESVGTGRDRRLVVRYVEKEEKDEFKTL